MHRGFRFLLLFALLVPGTYGQSLDGLFGNSAVSAMLNDQLGSTVIAIIHPLCKHEQTTFDTSSGDLFRFRTRYRFLAARHELRWAVKLDRNGFPLDIEFLADSNPVKTGSLANRVKRDLGPVVQRYLDKVAK
jgi:hypothetical protein